MLAIRKTTGVVQVYGTHKEGLSKVPNDGYIARLGKIPKIGQRIWGVHGIWTKGKDSVDPCGAELERKHGFTYLNYDYPHNKLIQQRDKGLLVDNAMELAATMRNGDHIIAHSNGASIVHKAMELTNGKVRLGTIVLVAPAFEATKHWYGCQFKRLAVIHNKHDRALLAGRYLYKHKFGDLGRSGYDGPVDPRIKNYPLHQRFGADWPLNHSWMFRDSAVLCTANMIARIIEDSNDG